MDSVKQRRTGAFFVDIVLLGIIVTFLESIIEPLNKGVSYSMLGIRLNIRFGVTFLLYISYFLAFDILNRGNTLGKIIFGIKVVYNDNTTPEHKHRLKRTLLKIVSIIVLPVSILLFFLNDSFTIHDHYTKTVTVRGK